MARKHSAQKVVDIACGTGKMTVLLQKKGLSVTGVDISEQMLAVAQQKCRAVFVCQDMRKLALPTRSHMAVCVNDGVNYLKPSELTAFFAQVAQNLADSYRLLFLNVLPNIVHLLFALLPIPIYMVFGSGFLQMIVMFLLMMAGGLYFPLVWQTHMMKTFALFHPVEVKKKKGQATAQAR